MEKNLILEGLLSMVTELKEKQEAQVTPASREETLERLNAIVQVLSELHSNPAIPEKDLQAIQSQLDEIRNGLQSQQKHIEDTKKIVLETYRSFKVMLDTLGSCKTDKEEAAPLPLYQRDYLPGIFPVKRLAFRIYPFHGRSSLGFLSEFTTFRQAVLAEGSTEYGQ